MRRYALRDDQWDRIKDFLPGREGHVGGTAADNRLFVEAVLFRSELAFLGATFRSVSVIGKSSTSGSASGRRVEFSNASSSYWRATPTTNT